MSDYTNRRAADPGESIVITTRTRPDGHGGTVDYPGDLPIGKVLTVRHRADWGRGTWIGAVGVTDPDVSHRIHRACYRIVDPERTPQVGDTVVKLAGGDYGERYVPDGTIGKALRTAFADDAEVWAEWDGEGVKGGSGTAWWDTAAVVIDEEPTEDADDAQVTEPELQAGDPVTVLAGGFHHNTWAGSDAGIDVGERMEIRSTGSSRNGRDITIVKAEGDATSGRWAYAYTDSVVRIPKAAAPEPEPEPENEGWTASITVEFESAPGHAGEPCCDGVESFAREALRATARANRHGERGWSGGLEPDDFADRIFVKVDDITRR